MAATPRPSLQRSPARSPSAAAAAASLALLAAPLLAQTPSQTWTGTHTFDHVGSCVAVVGDVDGDGIDDIAFGSPDADYTPASPPITFTDVGVARVVSGATGAVLHSWRGDLGGGTQFGFSVAPAGDVDGDGRADVLVGVPRADGPALTGGLVRLYSGATGLVLRTFWGLQTNARFGHAIDGGHDVDGDGVLDVLIGSPYENIGGSVGHPSQEGNARVFSSDDGSLLWEANWTTLSLIGAGTMGQQFDVHHIATGQNGTGVAMIGDGDGDGYAEIATSAPSSDYEFLVWESTAVPQELIFASANAGAVRVLEPFDPLVPIDGIDYLTTANSRLGDSLAALDGDVDPFGPGLAAGAPAHDSGAGLVRLYAVGGLLATKANIVGAPGAGLGASVASIGDVDGDGWVDVLAGAPDTDVGTFNPQVDKGRAHVFRGLTGDTLATYDGLASFDRLGQAVAGGDVDGDGIPDVIAGAPDADGPQVNNGKVHLFPGHDCVATWLAYGAGWPGTLGIPNLVPAGGGPQLGETMDLAMENSLGAPTPTWLLLGLTSTSLPVKDGTLLVDALLNLPFVLPAGTTTLPLEIPADPGLCGGEVFLQVIEADAGASKGASFSRGLRLTLGW